MEARRRHHLTRPPGRHVTISLHITGDTAAADLLTNNPLALLVGMLLNQRQRQLRLPRKRGSSDAAEDSAAFELVLGGASGEVIVDHVLRPHDSHVRL